MRLKTEVLIEDVAEYGRQHGRGAWAELGRASGLSPVTIGKIARAEVQPTLDSWNKLHRAAPKEIRPPLFEHQVGDFPVSSDAGSWEGPLQVGESGPDAPRPSGRPRRVPLIAYVSAGEAFAWTDCQLEPGQALEWLPAPPEGPFHPNMYCVRVRGDSMLPILKDGDTLYIHPEQPVMNHDLVVYRDQDSAFVKRVGLSGELIILKSLNPTYPDMVKNKTEALVLQRVVWIKP
ncbi:MAG: S24 family peptidase [Thermodesulfobacteriota bacterium]